jgi:hypothetical protein
MSAPKIPDTPDWDVVRETLRRMKLDKDNPMHWLFSLKAHIEERRSRIPDKKWTTDRLLQLIADVAQVKRERPNEPEANICRILAKRGAYGDTSAATLRRKLQDARNIDDGAYMDRIIDMMLEDFEVEGGGNARERLREWLTTGVTHYWEDKAGNLHSSPPEPPPPGIPDPGIRLTRK